jgi:nucleotide-binding universal stress UspA family protein
MHVLLAVDGSDFSYEAVQALAPLARADNVLLLHVMDVPRPMYPSVIPEVARDIHDTIERGMREDGERLLNRVASLLPLNAGPVVKRLEIGKPTAVILEVAEQEETDLIVMGARGVGLVRELALGSVSHRVASHASCPVLIVGSPMRAIRNVVLAVEQQEDAETAIAYLNQRPFKNPCDVTVFTVMPYASPVWPVGAMIPLSLQKDMMAQATEFVTGVSARLAASGYRAKGEAALGMPAGEILQEASKRQADLIIVGSRHAGVSRLVLGSVSHTVLHRAPCAVLVIR